MSSTAATLCPNCDTALTGDKCPECGHENDTGCTCMTCEFAVGSEAYFGPPEVVAKLARRVERLRKEGRL